MSKLRDDSLESAIKRLHEEYQSRGLEQEFSSILHKHTVKLPDQIYKEKLMYNVGDSIKEHIKIIEDFRVSLKQIQLNAEELAGWGHTQKLPYKGFYSNVIKILKYNSLYDFYMESVDFLNNNEHDLPKYEVDKVISSLENEIPINKTRPVEEVIIEKVIIEKEVSTNNKTKLNLLQKVTSIISAIFR